MARPVVHVWAPRLAGFGGGIAACAREVVRASAVHGWDVRTCAKDDPCRGASSAGRGAGCVPAAMRTLAFAALVTWRALRERPRLIVSLHANFGPLAWLLGLVLGVPFAIVAHGVEIGDVLSPMRRRALRKASAVWAVSRWTRERVIALGVPASRVAVVGNTFDASRFTCAGKTQAPRAVPVVLTVARLDASEGYKGCDVVLHALAHLHAQGRHVRYRVVGSGDDLPRLQELAARLGIAALVQWCGQLDDEALADAYREADVFVMPSRGEGFGIVFLEALASGTAVIGGNADGTVDALADGRLGLLVDPGGHADVAQALGDMLAGQGPSTWFDPQALRAECIRIHGREAFDARIADAIALTMGGRA